MRYDSFAQEYEDIILYAILGNVQNGFYIDIGANDPVNCSVTKFFYDRGWHGINVEPLRECCLLFDEQRPRDINLCVGVGNRADAQKGQLPLYLAGGCSTFDDSIAHEFKFDMADKPVIKSIMTLGEIYRGYCEFKEPIHFCKIDVEGYERQVLEGIDDWERFRPWVFVLEATKPQTLIPSHENWEQILLDHGYSFAYQFCVNRYYIDNRKEHLLEKAYAIDTFFRENTINRLRMFGRPSKKLKEKMIIFGMGQEFKDNVNRILQRAYVVACSDNRSIPEEEYWKKRFITPDRISSCEFDKVLICTHKYYKEIEKQLKELGIEAEQMVDIEYLRFDKL